MSKFGFGRIALLAVSMFATLAIFSPAAFAAGAPIVTAGAASNLSLNTATLNGTVDPNGASTTYKFEYGKSKLYGKSTTVRSQSKAGAVSEIATGLEPLTTYHFRVSATNSFGTTVSEDKQFEMLLAWRWAGKFLSEAPSQPVEFETYIGPFSGTAAIKGKIGLTTVEILCSNEGGPGLRADGALESEYKLPLVGCTTILNGKAAPACKPQEQSFVLSLNGFFGVVGNQQLTLGKECAIGSKIDFTGGGFAIGAMAEQVDLPISLTGYIPTQTGLTISFTGTWILEGANKAPFGIS
jgi:hypothetical protein